MLNVRSRINQTLQGRRKSARTAALLGVPSIRWYRTWLESQFQPGMTWENYGAVWQIDHILAVSRFDLSCPVNQGVAFCYENTRPLWTKDNLARGNRIAPSDVDILL